ncbi:MAG TPA: sigma-70 family RNA polymerase sigma factor [Candidatus Dormibacteraeota bacterium]|nr:sigma-70 family RNA polymerase sigma factor [Candidatus Dormibacteraeota bacterium]
MERNQIAMPRVPKLGHLTPIPHVAVKAQDKTSLALNDRELVRDAQAGDKEAFEELVRRHQQRVFAVAGGVLRRREDVEDIAQQVFVKAYFALKRFDGRAAFSTWLYKITLNECWDLLRKKKVRPLVYESDLSEEQARQVLTSESRGHHGADIRQVLETRQRVERLLAGLDQRDRVMLTMKEVGGFGIEEIAEVLNLNANTVKVRLFRARRRIVSMAQQRKD